MKLSHKIVMVSAAALMGISPVIGTVQNTTSVQAAKTTKKSSSKKTTAKKSSKKTVSKKKTTKKSSKKSTAKKSTKKTSKKSSSNTVKADIIVLSHNSYVYFSNGKRNKNYKVKNKVWPKIGKGATIKAFGTKTIKGQLYYFIGNNSYIKAANIATVNGKKVNYKAAKNEADKTTTKSITLTHNAYVYNKNGKRIKKAGTLKKNTTIIYLGTKKIKGKNYYNLGKGQYVKTANAKVVKKSTNVVNPADEDTYVRTVRNSIIYDENGNNVNSPSQLVIKGTDSRVLSAKKIGDKWYYEVGEDQWIKAVNAYVVSGPTLIKDSNYKEPKPITNTNDTIVTLRKDAPTYNSKGKVVANNSFASGYSLRVSKLVWIWVPSENQPVEFYKIASDSSSYVRVSDVDLISGVQLTPINTSEEARESAVIATASDKTELNNLINNANSVKNSDAYKLASSSLQSDYDTAINSGQNTSMAGNSTLLDVKNAVDAINKAQAALNGSKVSVADRNDLSANEIDAIIKLAAQVNNVSESDIKFADNNQNLVITSSNGYTRTVPVTDYIN